MNDIEQKSDISEIKPKSLRMEIPKLDRRFLSLQSNSPRSPQSTPLRSRLQYLRLDNNSLEISTPVNLMDQLPKNQQQIKKEKKEKLIKMEEMMRTTHTEQEGEYFTKEKSIKSLNKKDYFDLKINTAFNQIRDLNCKDQLHSAIKLLDNKEERSQLIDKILKRKQEKLDADQILKISKVQPLINRFMRKMKRATYDIDSPRSKSNYTNNNNLNSQRSFRSEISQREQTSIRNIRPQNSQKTITEQQDNSMRQSNSDIVSMKIISDSKKREPSLGSKAIFLTIFSKKKVEEGPAKSRQNSIVAYKEQYQRVTCSTGRKINFNQVSENSNELIKKGKELARQKVNELLKDVQKQSLAAHFKSFALKNRFDMNNTSQTERQINTFHTDMVEKYMKEEKQKMRNYANYKNQLDATKVVKNEIINYIDKYKQDPDDFLIYSKIIGEPYIRQIETQLHKNCVDNELQKLENYQKLTYAFKKECSQQFIKNLNQVKKQFLQRKPSIDDHAASLQQNNPLQNYLITSTKISQGQLIDTYQSRKSHTISRRRGISPFNFTKGFQSPQDPSPIHFRGSRSQRTSNVKIDTVLTTPGNYSTQQSSVVSRSPRVRSPKQNYEFQKSKINYTDKKLFAYQKEANYLTDNPLENDILGTDEDKIQEKEEQMKTFEKNKQLGQIIKNIQTVDRWRLNGSLHYTGESNKKNTQELQKNDDSLVSFTEIKLDKLYRKTLKVQTDQRFLERMQEYNSNILRRFQRDVYLKTTEKHKNSLKKYKNDILYTTSYKLKSGEKYSLQLA